MITERLSFRATYGQGDTLVQLFKEQFPTMVKDTPITGARIYTDFTGPMFSVIVESDFPDIDAYMTFMKADNAEYATAEFQAWFGRMMEVTEAGDRQVLNLEKLI